MGNLGHYGDTSTTWTDGTQYVWISNNSNYYYATKPEKKKKERDFIKEDDFMV